jgi:hypothetical protein
MSDGGRAYKSEWWSKKLRKKFLVWASYFIVGVYLITVAAFIILSLFLPQAADQFHMALLKDLIFNFSSPVILFAILLIIWSREA